VTTRWHRSHEGGSAHHRANRRPRPTRRRHRPDRPEAVSEAAQEPGFELNRPEARGAKILLTGRNFGCGSSREHAPWALQDWGFEAIVAPSFGDIFRTNCVKIGLLPVVLPQQEVKELMQERGELTIDLEEQTIGRFSFEFDPFERHCLLEGLDDIARALQHEDEIAAFEATNPARFATTAL
jgi:3-isopropylmalate/(R)-2-methylmalate dehydratase small subunit